ncbi:hypothetical protein D1646_22020 [Pseudoflavonifractor sp. 60]|nr:hypothetical protein [Pseudoflavonifractor sp. 60]
MFSLVLCGAMLVSLCAPAVAEEEDGAAETYIVWTWDGSKLVKSTPDIPEDITTIDEKNVETLELNGNTTNGWYIVRTSGVSKDGSIAVTGAVHLILADGCSLEVLSIKLSDNSSLSIYAQSEGTDMGELTAQYNKQSEHSNSNDAGIEVNAGSAVAIHGGKVTATGRMGAGIGGYSEKAGGSVNILGGTVAADSWIGAGIGGSHRGKGGEVIINGGTVTASSNGGGAGIGGGWGGDGSTIKITGGTVTANSWGKGAGIGGSDSHDGGQITITGGTVGAFSNGGAGIGGGWGVTAARSSSAEMRM